MESKKIGEQILRHLGGTNFITMTGVKNFLIVNNTNIKGLRMELPKNKSGANYLRIDTINKDTYNMHFYKCIENKKGIKIEPKVRIDKVLSNKLRENFSTITGLNTHL